MSMNTARRMAAAGLIVAVVAGTAFSQQEPPLVVPGGAAPAPAPVSAPGFGSAQWVNAGIFVALSGAALYAICRHSNRV
ncbi:MAG TPA: hypothetical protein VM165_04380 [Planctomycetaceae bacterium]|nr:hypothetical protein [Planctomycetaceae bacterium]